MATAIDPNGFQPRLAGAHDIDFRMISDMQCFVRLCSASFDSDIDEASFTIADVTLTGPSGAVAITGVSHLMNHTYRIAFAKPSSAGTHTLTVGPNITDAIGNRMDQNGNGSMDCYVIDGLGASYYEIIYRKTCWD